MRGVMAFLVWLYSLWIWFKAFFRLRWFKAPPLDQARSDESLGLEQLRSNEGQRESALTDFLSSLPGGDIESHLYYDPGKDGFRLYAHVGGQKGEFSGDEATRREFLAAVASSKVESRYRSIEVNLSLHKLNSPKQLEEIVGALACSNNFKTVRLDFGSGYSAVQMAECVLKLLSGNKAIEDLQLESTSKEVVGREAGELLAKGLHGNRILKSLDLWGIGGVVNDEAMEVLIKPLTDNDCVLQCLELGKMTDVGLEHLGVMLATNTSLKELRYSDTKKSDEVYMRGYTSLREALCINRSLQHLRCTITSSMELKVLLEPLMPMNNNPEPNTTLVTLHLSSSRIGGEEGVDILADMISTNTSLSELRLFGMRELDGGSPDAVENTVAILEALKINKSLKTMRFQYCKGVGGYKVLGTMMDLLLENHQLEQIDLDGTTLESSGEYVQSELEKSKKLKIWDLIKGMANVSPKPGRVFLCGDPYAGKTTLRKSIKDLLDNDFKKHRSSRFPLLNQAKKKFAKDQTPKESYNSKAKVTNERTCGFEVDQVECDGIGISIWDMAGQTDYHSFHDLVIPNLSADGSCSLFLLMCNPMQGESSLMRNISEIKSEIEYWLWFIASNTRRSWSYRPHVSIVMTHFDYWNNEADFAIRIEDIVKELKVQFQQVVEFDVNREVFKVNGEDVSHAHNVFDFIKTHLKQLLKRLPKTLKACSEVQHRISAWNAKLSKPSHDLKTSKLPMLKWEEFSEKICNDVEELNNVDKELAERKQEFVAISLHDGGHIMYHEEGKFIITNPHWFCHDIMGEVLHHFANVAPQLEMVSKHGIISIKHWKHILLKFVGGEKYEGLLDEILSMMKKLNICYEQDDNNVMVPSLLGGSGQSLSWQGNHECANLTYVGRRLSCKDTMRTMLSLGFFPRLQVSFFKKFQNNNVGNSYQLFQNVIIFIWNGIEVIIGFDQSNINILLRSEHCQDKMLEFLENGIVMHIRDLLSSPTLGCPGVILVEYVLRPKCVQDLIDSKDCNFQFVSMDELELEVTTSGFNATHNWKQCGHLGPSFDKVESLLGTKAWKELLERRCKVLQEYEREILHTSSPKHSLICKNEMNFASPSLMQQFFQRCTDSVMKTVIVKLDNMDTKMDVIGKKVDVVIKKVDDIIHMQEIIMKMQHSLMYEVSSRIDNLMGFSIEMQQAQVPKLAYLSQVGKKKLLTHFIPGLEEFQLHLMCESRNGIHDIVNQEGCKVYFGTNGTKTFVTMLEWGLKMATILTKIGAHVAGGMGGMGGMVPDFGEALQLAGLVLDTPDLVDKMSTFCIGSLPNDVKKIMEISNADRLRAQKWMVGFLEPKCKEKSTCYAMFKLKKVMYKVVQGKQSVAWICDECERHGLQSGVILQ